MLQATTRRAATFGDEFAELDRRSIDDEIERGFRPALERRRDEERAAGHLSIRERFESLCEEFSRSRKHIPADQRQRRNQLISELRGLLAASCVEALEPDLVILDEFQRFKHLLVDDPPKRPAWPGHSLRGSDPRPASTPGCCSCPQLHTAFAMRFGDEESGDRASGDQPARAPQLREAFNSPYWPFVLVSTAVGQEGLDFHPYCHVVVHWNLPTNPVDLEQREGRVHRKGHAIRKNVALEHGAGALATAGDPWAAAFALAAQDRREDDNELVPYWIYPVEGGAQVERHVLALPMSRELARLATLRNALAVYRLAFGQARQEDVIDHLLTRLGPERAAALSAEVRIDLRPPATARS